jgi:hypothetical protein
MFGVPTPKGSQLRPIFRPRAAHKMVRVLERDDAQQWQRDH